MPTPDQLKVFIEKLAAGTATDEGIEAIRQACAGSDKITLQVAKYINNINQAQDSQFGDRIISQNQNPDIEILREVIFQAFEEHRTQSDTSGLKKANENVLGRLINLPEPPLYFIERSEEIQALKKLVLLKKTTGVEIVTSHKVGVHGMAGIGKSVLTSMVAYDAEIQQAFPDGVLWLKIGQEHSFTTLQLQLAKMLGWYPQPFINNEDGRAYLSQRLANKNCLIVLDDVWKEEQLTAFDILGKNSCLLFTTRDGQLITGFAVEYELTFLSNEQALNLLARLTATEIKTLPTAAREVAQQCGNLPLALYLCGVQVKDGMCWEDLRDALQKANLEFLDHRDSSIYKSLKVSIDTLTKENKHYAEYYQELTVFAPGSFIPEVAITNLWLKTYKLQERDGRQLITILARKALLQTTGNAPKRFVSMHDLQYNYLAHQVNDFRPLHEKLLAAYQQKSTDGWHTVPNDGYFFEYFTYHLYNAARQVELRKLLLNFNWLQKKLENTNVNALISDYNYFPDDTELRLIQKAIVLSAHILEQDKKQLWSQLQGRLIKRTSAAIKVLLQQKAPFPQFRTLSPSLNQADASLLRIFTGHSDHVKSLAVANDGKHVLSGSSDKTIKLWNLETGENIHTFREHDGIIYAVAFISERMQAISGAADGTLKLWDLEKCECTHTFQEHVSPVYAVAIIPKQMQAISGAADGTLKLWDLEKRECIYSFQAHEGSVNAVAVFPEKMQAISGSSDCTLKLWDLKKMECTGTLKGHQGEIKAVAVFSEQKQVISGSADGTLKLWDLHNFKCINTFKGHKASVYSVAAFTDQIHFVSSSTDKTLKLWNSKLKQRNCKLTLKDNDWANAIAIIPGSENLIGACDDYTLKQWSLNRQNSQPTIEGHSDAVRSLAVSMDAKVAISAFEDGTLKLWDLGNGKFRPKLIGHHEEISAVTVTADAKQAISACPNGILKFWDLNSKTNNKLQRTVTKSFPITKIALIPTNEESILIASDNILVRLSLNNSVMEFLPKVHKGMITALAITANGQQAISASNDGTLRQWDLKNEKCKRTLKTQAKTITAVAMTLDGKWSVYAGDDNNVILWNSQKGRGQKNTDTIILSGHTDWISAVAITADGKRVISGSYDKTLRLWNLDSGNMIACFYGDSAMLSCAITSNGRIVVAGEQSGRVHFLCLED